MGWINTVVTLAAGFFATGGAWATPQVDMFTPTGQAKDVRQVAVRFSEPMVAFGDHGLPEPFSVRCNGDPDQLKGRGRWADQRNWVYDFDENLPAGQICRFTLNSNLKSAAGQPLEGGREFSFHTGGTSILASLPEDGYQQIDEDQSFVLALDAPLEAGSLSNAWCEAAGINERIPLKLLSDMETRELLAANRYNAFNLYSLYFKNSLSINKFKIEDKRFKNLPVIGVRCARRLPAGADIDRKSVV